MMLRPQLWIVAGPNGSGKTTLTDKHFAGRIPIINPDVVAKEINPDNPTAQGVSLQAGRVALKQQQDMLKSGQSFALETTFSGNRELKLMRDAKEAGYKVNLAYVCTQGASVNRARVGLRVQNGGHFVPSSDVIRRYDRSLQNLPEGLKLADRAWLLDNSERKHKLVACLERNQVKSMSNRLPKWVQNARLPALEQGVGL